MGRAGRLRSRLVKSIAAAIRARVTRRITRTMPKFLIVDDHPLFREALSRSIQPAFGDAILLEAGTMEQAVDMIRENSDIDLVLLDLNLPGTSGFAGLLTLRTQFPKLPVVVVSGSDDRRIVAEALSYGVVGFIPKSAPKAMLTEAIQETLDGGLFLPPDYRDIANQDSEAEAGKDDLAKQLASLTAQQFRVLQLLREGKLNKQIAYDLDVGETTVKAHVSAILHKLKVFSRTQAVIKARDIEFENIVKSADD